MNKIKIITTLLLFILSFNVFAQMTENVVDEQGKRQGVWKSYTPEGKLKFTGQFKDDQPYGTFTYYYPTGEKKAVTSFEEKGMANTQVFHKNGQLMAKGAYKNKKRDGKWLFYSDYDGKLVSEENYSNGIRNGNMINYFPESGKIAEQVNFKNDWEDGPYKQFYENGNLQVKGTYKQGKLVGEVFYYFSSGNTKVKGQYKNGVKEGYWSFYNEKGVLTKNEKYKNGKIVDTKEFIKTEPEEIKPLKINDEDLKKMN
ncbi:MAG: toxin-antitoxin system YwqK family antitoxin [Bacteroidales bacterium]